MNTHLVRRVLFALLLALFSIATPASSLELTLENIWYAGIDGATRIAVNPVDHTLMVSVPRMGELRTLNGSGSVIESMTTFVAPTALAFDASGACFVIDEQAVWKLDVDGNVLFPVGGSDSYFAGPHDVVVAPDGRIYVADADDSIKVFDTAGTPLFTFGGNGWFNGRLDAAVSLAVNAARSELVVADQNNFRIQVYNLDGDSLNKWGRHGTGSYLPGDFLRLWGLDIDALGRIWTYDAILDAVQVFDPLGSFLFMCRLDVMGFRGGVDVAVDGDYLYLTAPTTENIYVFRIWDDTPPPETDFRLTIHPEEGALVLRWDPIRDAISYHLFRSTSPLFEADSIVDLGLLSGTSFTDTEALALADRGYYRVEALLPAGTCNVPTLPVNMTTVPLEGGNGAITEHHDAPHNLERAIWCYTCHFPQLAYPNPLPNWWRGDHLCKSCHVESGMATAEQNHFAGNAVMYCTTCHDPHSQHPEFPHDYIRQAVLTPNNGWRAVSYSQESDYVHGAPNFDGICEVCHTATEYYRNNGGAEHYPGEDCGTCHSHLRGFAAGD